MSRLRGKKTSGYVRVVKFSLVGSLGIGVQLAALVSLSAAGLNYLPATGLAVEAAVLHNFLWHLRFTWVDRRPGQPRQILSRLLRFHLSNGIVSLAGNLVLMRILAGTFAVPLIASNFIAVSICSLANFVISDRWVFSPAPDVGKLPLDGVRLSSR
jgi:putative flippase GtrA